MTDKDKNPETETTSCQSNFSDVLLLKLLTEMRRETVEYLWDHADAEDLDKKPANRWHQDWRTSLTRKFTI